MKKLMLIAMAVMVSAAAVQANEQMQRRGEQKPERKERVELTVEQIATKQTDKMKEEFNLSDKQYKQIYTMNLEKAKQQKAQREEMEAKRKAEMEARKAKQEEMKKQREANLAQMKKILSAEQFAEFEKAMKKAQRKEMKCECKGGKGHMRDGKGQQRGRCQMPPRGKGKQKMKCNEGGEKSCCKESKE